jgi:hypothetical protein
VGALALTARLAGRRLFSSEVAGETVVVLYTISLATVFYTMLISCFAGIGESRYRIPVDLLMIAATMIGFTIWKRALAVLPASAREETAANP